MSCDRKHKLGCKGSESVINLRDAIKHFAKHTAVLTKFEKSKIIHTSLRGKDLAIKIISKFKSQSIKQ
jgi:hypothetical protein